MRYDALAPRPEVLCAISCFYANQLFLLIFFASASFLKIMFNRFPKCSLYETIHCHHLQSLPFSKEGHEGGGGGGVLIPLSSKLFFLIPAQVPQSQPVLLKFKCHFHFLLFLFHESQSQCTKSHSPASKKGKSQLPFYSFTTLSIQSCQL